ncbi:unnamed protein product [Nippostrongylus brasiliensis]|uniref:Sphingosine kinase 1 (inferred by orthology to a C. elegans protein) n=1 Tax=Nippostrongylus brasiliensis TaxID=27835 RepID=A0A0N4Y480_NIPBR|nr:unnamed protein product [Nippostrongylus brasiliensis]
MQWLYQNAYAAEMGAMCCRRRSPQIHDIRDVESVAIGRVLVFVNPNSGSGKGVKTFRERVAPQLKRNHIDFEFVVTSGPNHAKTMVRTRDDLGKFNGVIILSGDGLVFEVINGLSEREDRADIIPSLPIGIVPSGSGNGLLSSLFSSRGEPLKNPKFTQRAIDICCQAGARAQMVNLVHVQTDKENIAAFMSIGWGLMADIDIESERWRGTLGSNRFALGGFIRSLNLRSYRGRLWYKPYMGGKRIPDGSYDIYGKTVGERMETARTNSSERLSDSQGSCPSPRPSDSAWRMSQSEKVVSLEEEVPGEWIMVEDDFVNFYAVTVSHISNDGPFAPRAQLDDDRIYLTYILKKDVPNRLAVMNFLISIENQKHLEFPFVKSAAADSCSNDKG